MSGQLLDFSEDVVAGTADFSAADVRYDTKAADFVAPLHDGHVRLGAVHFRPPLSVFQIGRIAIKRQFHRTASQVFNVTDHPSKLVNILCAKDKIEMRNSAQQSFPFLLRNTSTDAYDQSFFLLL